MILVTRATLHVGRGAERETGKKRYEVMLFRSSVLIRLFFRRYEEQSCRRFAQKFGDIPTDSANREKNSNSLPILITVVRKQGSLNGNE